MVAWCLALIRGTGGWFDARTFLKNKWPPVVAQGKGLYAR